MLNSTRISVSILVIGRVIVATALSLGATRNLLFAQASNPLSSNFPGPLWTVVAPSGGSASVDEGHLLLSVPGGRNHESDANTNQALRLMQPIGNIDFDVSTKLELVFQPAVGRTGQGLMVATDGQTFLVVAFQSDGDDLSFVGRSVTRGSTHDIFHLPVVRGDESPIFLRLKRAGEAYTAFYSIDGLAWISTDTFEYIPRPALIGPFASNYGSSSTKAPAVTMSVDWFEVLP